MKLYGKNPVIERLRANPNSVRKIFIQEDFDEALLIRSKAKHIPVIVVPKTKIQKISRNINAQGIVADVDEFLYVPYNELLEHALEKKRSLLFLDRIVDPQNLGAIIRSAASIGRFSIVLPTHDAVTITETVLRVACGGDNYIPVAKVSNLGPAIKKAKEAGFNVAATVVEGGQNIYETTFPFPMGFVVGSEQRGIKSVILKNVDFEISIPMPHSTMSLNVAQATTILCYEITKQQTQYKKQKQ